MSNTTPTVRLDPPADGLVNMRLDRELVERHGGRVYGWSSPWITLGRFQVAESTLRDGCDVPWVRRPTGGGGVLHGHDVTFALGVPLVALRAEGRSISTIYRELAAPILGALRACGISASLGESSSGKARLADCFAHASPCDIVDEGTGAKACGCALRVYPSSVLVQASIPVRLPMLDPESVFTGPVGTPTALNLEPAEFAAALQDAFRGLLCPGAGLASG